MEIRNANDLVSIKAAITREPARSAWARGVREYAIELLDNIAIGDEVTEAAMLNGAKDWREYSYGGCALIYDGDIAERLCSPSGYKRSHYGERNPNNHETWLDVQARALFQACRLVLRLIETIAAPGRPIPGRKESTTKEYICVVCSNSSREREYTVTTTSAMKCANEFGCCEGGEVITVYTKSGKALSQVRWTPEDGGKYFRSVVW